VADLVPIRYGRMLADPFAFLRGSAALMAYDLASTSVSGIQVQACGDCHLANFGLFATPERNLVFDLNDFDETLPGPWEWDLKRLAASFVVAGRARGFSDGSNEMAVLALAFLIENTCVSTPACVCWMCGIRAWTIKRSSPPRLTSKRANTANASLAKARASVAEYLFPKITALKDGHSRIVDKPPLVFHLPRAERYRRAAAQNPGCLLGFSPCSPSELFEYYRFEDFAFKVVGVGSVGRAATCFCSWPTPMTPCSCRQKKRAHRCWSLIQAKASLITTASAWWWDSA